MSRDTPTDNDMKERFFRELEQLENGTRDLSGVGEVRLSDKEINVTALYSRLLVELNQIDEIFTTHLKEIMNNA